MKSLKQMLTRWLLLVGWAVALAGCASGQSARTVYHSFSFDGWNDDWQKTAQLLEYRYGDGDGSVGKKAPEGDFLGYRSSVTGPMPVGEFLSVRWRLKASGEVLEQRVDLRERLPKNMAGHEVTFAIDERQLYVYVVTPEELNSSAQRRPSKTWRAKYNVAYEVYPTLMAYPGSR